MSQPKIAAMAARGFTLDGVPLVKDERLALPEDQFADLEGVGLVERAPAPKPAPAPQPRRTAKSGPGTPGR